MTQLARELGSSISYLSPQNVSAISWSELREIQQNTSVQWTPAQMFALVKKRLQGVKVSSCSRWTDENVGALRLVLFHRRLSVQTDDRRGGPGPQVTCGRFAELRPEESDSHEDANGEKGAEEDHQAYEEGPAEGRVAEGE